MTLDSVRSLKNELKQAIPSAGGPASSAVPRVGGIWDGIVSSLRYVLPIASIVAPLSQSSAGPEKPSLPSPEKTIALGVATGGRGDYKLAVRVENQALRDDPWVAGILKAARGEVDFRVVGRLRRLSAAAPTVHLRVRPLAIGSSVGHHPSGEWGTLGCFVRSSAEASEVFLLSNNHVIAHENKGQPGDAICQPGKDTKIANVSDRVAGLGRYVRLKRMGVNALDCALAQLDSGIEFDPRNVPSLGTLTNFTKSVLEEAEPVAKVGCQTGLTIGTITAFEVDDLEFQYGIGDLKFSGQIEIAGQERSPFALPGDSGALVVASAACYPVGLLFGGSDEGGPGNHGLAYANPIAETLDKLGVELIS